MIAVLDRARAARRRAPAADRGRACGPPSRRRAPGGPPRAGRRPLRASRVASLVARLAAYHRGRCDTHATTTPRAAVLSVHTSPDRPARDRRFRRDERVHPRRSRSGWRPRASRSTCSPGAAVAMTTRPSTSRRASASWRSRPGPCAPIPKADLPRFLPEFLGGVIRHAHDERPRLRHRAQPLLAVGLGRDAPRRSCGTRRSSRRSTRSAR